MRIQIKTVVYLLCNAAEDVTNQKRGIVGLFYFNRHIHTVKRVLQRDPNAFDWQPIRFVSAHVCYNDSKLRIINALFMLMIGRERRVRLRTHEGTKEDFCVSFSSRLLILRVTR